MIREVFPPAEPEVPVAVHGSGSGDEVNPACPMRAAVRGSFPWHVGDAPSGPDEVQSRGGLGIGSVTRQHDID
eukprot:9988360-Lingulodinium_polyedra.AAC.1